MGPMPMSERPDLDGVAELITGALADPTATWTLGGFGALARFSRTGDEAATPLASGRLGLVTPRGGIALDAAGAIPVAYETAFAGGWSHAVALCRPATLHPRPGSRPIAEAGRDPNALRPENLGDNWFDLGLDLPQGRLRLRSADPDALRILRAAVGRDLRDDPGFWRDLDAIPMVDHVVITPLGRIEIFGGSASASDGPRVFLVPKMLALGRTHAATATIPAGLLPVALLVPPHPCASPERAFDPARHAAFQAILARWGAPDLVALKARLAAGEAPATGTTNRITRNIARVVRLQAEAMTIRHGTKF